MEWNAIEGNWKQVSASLKQKWNALTNDDFQFVDRNKDALVARVHDRTGLERFTVERQLDAMIASLPAGKTPPDAPVPFPQSGAKPQGPG
jgi:uncharacterized protein YjbJ (UPF0337 family)